MKLLTIIGARPQFIKAAAVSRVIRNTGIDEVIIHTGQHFDKNMSEVFFTEMDIPNPDYNLNINSLSHGAMTGRMIEGIEGVIQKEQPDALIVYGDTNSTIAGALAAKKLHIKVAHVEAGLRSFNMAMPEEINRILTDRISDYLFCPTQTAVRNLQKEGYEQFNCQIANVGDVMFDASLYYSQMADEKAIFAKSLDLLPNEYVLCTVHRQENTDDPVRLRAIFDAFEEINQTKKVILPLHPRTRKILKEQGIAPGFKIIDPVGYFDIIFLMKNSSLIMTDSGGMQKEAYFFDKYCITLRDETEWIELVENHANKLAGADKSKILEIFTEFSGKKFASVQSLYGDGDASGKIVDYLLT
jgi:UDP-GlcNAc3NAcA epimerase